MAAALTREMDDPITTNRMEATKHLWHYSFWTANGSTKNLICSRRWPSRSTLGVDQNLREAINNLADENIRYLYNNWVLLLARAEDRKRASKAGWPWKRA